MKTTHENKDIKFNTGTGGFITVRVREKYVIFEFTQKSDLEHFLQNSQSEKRNTNVKYHSVWSEGKWVNTKVFTYKALVRK